MKAYEKKLAGNDEAKDLLSDYKQRLAAFEDFTPDALHADFKEFCAAKEIKAGKVVGPLRIAVSGKAAGFSMFDTLSILGKDRCIKRIERTLRR